MKRSLLLVILTGALAIPTWPGICFAADLRLLDAVKNGDRKAVGALINAHVDVNAPLPDGSNVLTVAAYRDEAEIVEMLLKAGARVNTADEYGETPLTLASLNASTRVVAALLAHDADANAAR